MIARVMADLINAKVMVVEEVAAIETGTGTGTGITTAAAAVTEELKAGAGEEVLT